MTKITTPSFAIFAIVTPMAPEIVDLRADEPTVKAVEPRPPKLSRQFRFASSATSPAIPSIKDARNTHKSLHATGTNVDQLGKTGTVFAGQPLDAKR
ncbi:hypothetical protein R1flu_005814 [Riccia fluitans]|uniref:Uncharacterized protein n=1 Tax=Riccia fluitans TaxID=41844 RepID=A0ABD1YUG8_9MARC